MLSTWCESCKLCITRVTGHVCCVSQMCEICGLCGSGHKSRGMEDSRMTMTHTVTISNPCKVIIFTLDSSFSV